MEKKDGGIVAQCPVCAAKGGDKKGIHLIVFPDGGFSCVANQGDKEHNKEILKLVGVGETGAQTRGKVQVRAYKIPKSTVIQTVPRRTVEHLGFKRMESPLVRSRAVSDGTDTLS